MGKQYNIDRDFFKEWSTKMAYILGYWFADGCIWSGGGHHNINFTSNDRQHLEKIKSILQSDHKIYSRIGDNSYKLEIGCIEMYDDIIKLGGCERKSNIVKFPNIPKEYLWHFIRGYFDGDGSVYFRKKEPRISFTGNIDFINGLMEKLPYKVKLQLFKNNICCIKYTCEYAQDILFMMYGCADLYLDRKYKRYKMARKWKRQRKIRCDSDLFNVYGLPINYMRNNYENSCTE